MQRSPVRYLHAMHVKEYYNSWLFRLFAATRPVFAPCGLIGPAFSHAFEAQFASAVVVLCPLTGAIGSFPRAGTVYVTGVVRGALMAYVGWEYEHRGKIMGQMARNRRGWARFSLKSCLRLADATIAFHTFKAPYHTPPLVARGLLGRWRLGDLKSRPTHRRHALPFLPKSHLCPADNRGIPPKSDPIGGGGLSISRCHLIPVCASLRPIFGCHAPGQKGIRLFDDFSVHIRPVTSRRAAMGVAVLRLVGLASGFSRASVGPWRENGHGHRNTPLCEGLSCEPRGRGKRIWKVAPSSGRLMTFTFPE